MSRLSDTALLILNAAAQRDDGLAFPFPENARGDVQKAARSLLDAGYLRRIPVRDNRTPVWRTVRGKGPVTLRLSLAGLKMLKIRPGEYPYNFLKRRT